jgi:hypothetical protein
MMLVLLARWQKHSKLLKASNVFVGVLRRTQFAIAV